MNHKSPVRFCLLAVCLIASRSSAWENVRKVMERPRYFHFVLNQYESIIIPKRFLLNGSDEQVLKEIIAAQVGNKAKL